MIVGIGCDIVEIERIAQQKEAVAKRILTTKEYEQYDSLINHRKVEYLAGRFAAKEAIFKALKTPISVFNIEILSGECGEPLCFIEGYNVHISIAHEKEYATAYAIVEE